MHPRCPLSLIAGLAAGIAALSCSPVQAQSAAGASVAPGYYISGGAGLNFLSDADTGNTSYRYDPGGLGVGALGYQFGNGFRAEGELAYRDSGVSDARTGAASGDTSAFSVMANGFYDFRTGTAYTPYAGAGLGLARVSFNDVTIPGGNDRIDDADLAFAYQAMVGVAYQLQPNLKVDLGYRYFGTETPRLRSANGTELNSHYRDHAAVVSLRYEFGRF